MIPFPTLSCSDVQFRSFRAEDVVGVNALFLDAYGLSYPYRISAIVPERTYYFVACNAQGEIVGFSRSGWLGVAHGNAYPSVHELGGYVVRSDYRRRGIGEELSRLCEEAAALDEGTVHISHAEPVCWGNGLASQKIFARHQFWVLGASIMKYPDLSTEWHGTQPGTTTVVARRAAAGQSFVQNPRFLPGEYEDLVQEMLAGCPSGSDAPFLGGMPTVVHHAAIVGANFLGSEFVDVPANWRDTLPVVARLREQGYLFSAFLPEHGCHEGRRFDYVRLYRAPATHRHHLNPELIGVIPKAQRVKDFLMAEYRHLHGG